MELHLTQEKKELFIKTSFWNSIIKVFKDKKNIDIGPYLVSIKMKSNRLTVKTNKPIINSEIIFLEKNIKEDFYKKVKNIGVEEGTFIVKYI